MSEKKTKAKIVFVGQKKGFLFSVWNVSTQTKLRKCALDSKLKNQLILLFNLFLILFVGFTILFGTIHEFHCTILANFYLYL